MAATAYNSSMFFAQRYAAFSSRAYSAQDVCADSSPCGAQADFARSCGEQGDFAGDNSAARSNQNTSANNAFSANALLGVFAFVFSFLFFVISLIIRISRVIVISLEVIISGATKASKRISTV